jgi:hypothetical protein
MCGPVFWPSRGCLKELGMRVIMRRKTVCTYNSGMLAQNGLVDDSGPEQRLTPDIIEAEWVPQFQSQPCHQLLHFLLHLQLSTVISNLAMERSDRYEPVSPARKRLRSACNDELGESETFPQSRIWIRFLNMARNYQYNCNLQRSQRFVGTCIRSIFEEVTISEQWVWLG